MRSALVLAIGLLLLAGPALAEKVSGYDNPGTPYQPQGDCPTTDYKSYTGSGGPIPDSGSITFGPIVIPDDGSSFSDVVLEVGLTHTWVGDLIIDLVYDGNCDPADGFDATANLACRPDSPACDALGCSSNYAGVYRFSDDGGARIRDVCGGGDPLPGCYAPETPMSAFDMLPKGGCFYLSVSDNAGFDTGNVGAIIVWAENDGGSTPTEAVTWSRIKSTF